MTMISCSEDNSNHIENDPDMVDVEKLNKDFPESYNDTTIIIEMRHIGISDKPISTILFTNKEIVDIEVSNSSPLIHKFKLSMKEITDILNIFSKGAYYSSVYENSLDYGSFEFKVTKNSVIHDFKVNRRDSISIFNEINIVLDNHFQARNIIDIILRRLNL